MKYWEDAGEDEKKRCLASRAGVAGIVRVIKPRQLLYNHTILRWTGHKGAACAMNIIILFHRTHTNGKITLKSFFIFDRLLFFSHLNLKTQLLKWNRNTHTRRLRCEATETFSVRIVARTVIFSYRSRACDSKVFTVSAPSRSQLLLLVSSQMCNKNYLIYTIVFLSFFPLSLFLFLHIYSPKVLKFPSEERTKKKTAAEKRRMIYEWY